MYSIRPKTANDRLRLDGADQVNIEANQIITNAWHAAPRNSRQRTRRIVLPTWFWVDYADGTGVVEKQEYCQDRRRIEESMLKVKKLVFGGIVCGLG